MDKYINQLISDIEKLLKKKPGKPSEIWDGVNLKNEAEVEDMSYIEQYLYGKKHELQHIVGIQKEALPPSDRLTDYHISILLPYLESLLEYHHFELSYPTKLDNRTKYELLFKEWDQMHVKVSYGTVGIEFCHYNEDECPIPGKCKSCEEFKFECETGTNSELNEDFSGKDLLPTPEQIEKFVINQKTEKVKKTIENLKPAEGNITGIFNYCNRWCERCKFTDRCTNYQFEKELGFYDGKDDKEKMIENLGAILSGTLSFLKSKMNEMDIDISNYEEDEKREINQARNHPLAILAKNYMKQTSKWMDSNFNYFSDVAAKLFNISRKSFKELNVHLETIGWHMTMIPVKIVRALNPREYDDDQDFHEHDSNATAKLVFECIDESIASFSFLHEKLSKKSDEILDFLTILSQIKAGLEKELPNARNFVRPGLDE